MDLKIRMYIGSVAAVAVSRESYEFEPFVLFVESIETAAAEARKHIFQRWPESEGWSDHVAVIAPLPAEMYAIFGDAAARNILDIMPPTENQTLFRFHPNEGEEGGQWPQTIH